MATAAQITANQANAAHSTGPRTVLGKSISAQNGLRHGFRSQSVLLPGDDPAEYQELLDKLTVHFDINPGDLTAARFVREMAGAEWRLRRARIHQEGLLTRAIEELAAANPALDPIQLQIQAHEQLAANSGYFRQLLRFEEKFERQYERAYRGWTSYRLGSSRAEHRAADLALKQSLAAPPPGFSNPGAPRPEAPPRNDTTEPNSPAPSESTPRNANCPCGSGNKFKRCCGRSAPPVLGRAA